MRVFLVPARSVEWIDNWDVLGLNATNSGGFKVSNLLVPQGYSINRDHLREVQVASPLYKFPLNGFFSVGFSAVALGIARAMLDAAAALNGWNHAASTEEGRATLRNNWRSLEPNERATLMKSAFIVRTPVMVLTRMGKTAPRDTMAILEAMPMPNQIITSGSSAMRGVA